MKFIIHAEPDEMITAARAAITLSEGDWPADGIRIISYESVLSGDVVATFVGKKNRSSITVISQRGKYGAAA